MYLRAKILLFPALPVLAVLAFTSPASATSATSVAGAHQQPLIHVPRFPAGPRASTVRPSAVTGTESNTYVGTKGTDTGTCPKTAPCATITYAESQTASSGTIHIADGTYNQSADLTQPVHLLGASESKVIIDGTNVDYTADGYFGVLAANSCHPALPGQCAVLLIDHQVGTIQLIKNITSDQSLRNAVTLAKAALAFGMPIVMISSQEDHMQGPSRAMNNVSRISNQPTRMEKPK